MSIIASTHQLNRDLLVGLHVSTCRRKSTPNRFSDTRREHNPPKKKPKKRKSPHKAGSGGTNRGRSPRTSRSRASARGGTCCPRAAPSTPPPSSSPVAGARSLTPPPPVNRRGLGRVGRAHPANRVGDWWWGGGELGFERGGDRRGGVCFGLGIFFSFFLSFFFPPCGAAVALCFRRARPTPPPARIKSGNWWEVEGPEWKSNN